MPQRFRPAPSLEGLLASWRWPLCLPRQLGRQTGLSLSAGGGYGAPQKKCASSMRTELPKCFISRSPGSLKFLWRHVMCEGAAGSLAIYNSAPTFLAHNRCHVSWRGRKAPRHLRRKFLKLALLRIPKNSLASCDVCRGRQPPVRCTHEARRFVHIRCNVSWRGRQAPRHIRRAYPKNEKIP